MKVWVIGRNYPSSSNGMQGSFELEQAKMLAKYGESVSYLACSLHPFKVIKKKGLQYWKEDSISIYTYSAFFLPRIYPLYFTKIRNQYWRKLLHKVKEKKGLPDVIHLHYPAMLMLADVMEDYYKLGVKIIVTEHWSKVLSNTLDKLEVNNLKKYFNIVDTFICVGKPLAKVIEQLREGKKTNITIVPNMVNEVFKPVISKQKHFEFIAVGRLVKGKQFDKIVIAFVNIFKDADARLTIIGNGPEYDRLKSIIANLKVEKQITLTGSLTRVETSHYVANADCLICYSQFETFGVPIIEAWACGLPVVATSAAAVIDNFDNRLGIEVSPESIQELRDAMIFIYQHINEYDKDYITKFARENFSEDSVYKKLLSIYK